MKKLISNESSKIPFANGDLTFGNRIINYCYSGIWHIRVGCN